MWREAWSGSDCSFLVGGGRPSSGGTPCWCPLAVLEMVLFPIPACCVRRDKDLRIVHTSFERKNRRHLNEAGIQDGTERGCCYWQICPLTSAVRHDGYMEGRRPCSLRCTWSLPLLPSSWTTNDPTVAEVCTSSPRVVSLRAIGARDCGERKSQTRRRRCGERYGHSSQHGAAGATPTTMIVVVVVVKMKMKMLVMMVMMVEAPFRGGGTR